MAATNDVSTLETTRHFVFTQHQMALLDEFIGTVHDHCIWSLQNPNEFPHEKALRAIITDSINLKSLWYQALMETDHE